MCIVVGIIKHIEECLLFYTNIHIAGTHAMSQIGKRMHRLHVDRNKIQVDTHAVTYVHT